ncbi:ABC transporter substrate-binding protein [Blautia sp.]|uniref:ABC transporter substrate-binding protein n=1 Tax=Blautia sp. TaxID=1955243 RepID=UPI00257CEEEA|nr:ABC transporter substrate-binding protein [Blautia sp.]
MKTKKLLAILITMGMITGMTACGQNNSNSTDENAKSEDTTENSSTDSTENQETTESTDSARGDFSDVSITMLNTKSEIESQLEAAAEKWSEETGAKLEVYTIGSGTPSQEISARYAAKNAPTLIMGDPQDVASICEEKGVDLSDESWAANGGTQYGISGTDGNLYSFPFCIEGRGMVYNKTAIEDTLGEDWDPSSVTNMDDFEALLEKLVENGMESPVALNQEDWSNAGHYFTQVYEEQDGTLATTEKFMEDLKAGSVDLMSNERFTSLMDTYDLLMKYNINKADPLAADYDENAADLAEGDVAFWFNGNWAWAEISDYIEDGTEIGIMPVPQNSTEGDANVNDYICGGATKQVMIDKECNDEEQQAAAKDFLDWLANTDEGNSVLIDDCSLVPAFSNITAEATNMLGQSVQQFTVDGKLFDQPSNYPGDHWSEVGAIMQKYLGGQIDRAEFAKEVQDYWTGIAE